MKHDIKSFASQLNKSSYQNSDNSLKLFISGQRSGEISLRQSASFFQLIFFQFIISYYIQHVILS